MIAPFIELGKKIRYIYRWENKALTGSIATVSYTNELCIIDHSLLYLAIFDTMVLWSDISLSYHLVDRYSLLDSPGYICSIWCWCLGRTTWNRCHCENLEPKLLDENENIHGHSITLWIQLVWWYLDAWIIWMEKWYLQEIWPYNSTYGQSWFAFR